jgi:hypothetical protein
MPGITDQQLLELSDLLIANQSLYRLINAATPKALNNLARRNTPGV